ncbi:MAG: hypothetical protein DRJ44_03910 [Thermoprotei archaeon]|nr:MAG: hypothetical protein DRJ44_03910 [Thermoprotei archaeon]
MRVVKVDINDTKTKELIAELIYEVLTQSSNVVKQYKASPAEWIHLSNYFLLKVITVTLEIYLDTIDDTIKKLAEEVGVYGEGSDG